MNTQVNKFPINWFYMGFVILASTGVLGFMAYDITRQFYDDWQAGQPNKNGWNLWQIILVILGCFSALLALLRKIYRDYHTQISEVGLSQPHLLGVKDIAWGEVTKVQVFNSFGYHIISAQKKIVVTPYAYKNPNLVIETIMKYLNMAQSNRQENVSNAGNAQQ